MSSYTPIIGAFGSFYELSVALNFAYAASDRFQEIIKDGFLRDARAIAADLKYKVKEAKSLINVTDEGALLDADQKEKIENKLKDYLDNLNKDSRNLQSAIDEKQNITTRQNKPLYIYVGFISLFMTFLSGHEVDIGMFPTNIIFTVLSLTVPIIVFFLFVILFTKNNVDLLTPMLILMVIMLFSFFFPLGLNPYVEENHNLNRLLLYVTLILAFSSFIFSMSHFFFSSLMLTIRFRIERLIANRTLDEIKSNLEKYHSSHDYFNNM